MLQFFGQFFDESSLADTGKAGYENVLTLFVVFRDVTVHRLLCTVGNTNTKLIYTENRFSYISYNQRQLTRILSDSKMFFIEKISLIPLVGIIYFTVSGGAFVGRACELNGAWF